MHAEWKIKQAAQRLRIDGTGACGKLAEWKFNEENRKRVRKAKAGGIDWWQYSEKILKKKLILFAKRCAESWPSTIVQEDKTPSHLHKAQQEVFDFHRVLQLLWLGNSPDLNMIEPCWPYMKRQTTVQGSTTFCDVMEQHWIKT